MTAPRRPAIDPFLVLDWSGTLVDDLDAVVAGANAVLAGAGRAPLDRDEYRREFELPYAGFYQRFAPDLSPARIDELFLSRLAEVDHLVRPLPHADRFVVAARASGRGIAVLTTVAEATFAEQSRRFGFAEAFDAVLAGVKDKRRALPGLLARLDWDPAHCLVVGDMTHDIAAGRAAGTRTCAVLTGYQDRARLEAAGPDLLVADLCELRAELAAADGAPDRPVVTVGALISDGTGRWLLVRTAKWNGKWAIPGGKVERGETMRHALEREIREETGLEIRDIRHVLDQEAIDHPEFHRPAHMLLVNFEAVASSAGVRLNNEAEECRWVTAEQAAALPLNEPTRRLLEEVVRCRPTGS